MQPLPAYRIESPDVISIEMLKLIPKPPYRAAIFDVLKIVANAPPDKPIDNHFVIEADGTVDLGPLYGKVHVTGMTIGEMNAALDKHLKQYLTDPGAYAQLARVAGSQPVTGQYLVGPDGTINLRKYGLVPISGKTVAEAKAAIEERLKKFLDTPEVNVDVVAYNSKVYFIITQGRTASATVSADCQVRATIRSWTQLAKSMGCRKFRTARRSGSSGRRFPTGKKQPSCRSIGTPSRAAAIRPPTIRYSPATGSTSARTLR